MTKPLSTVTSKIESPKLGNVRITFGIIVLNGEPFTRYCLRSIYPFAHEIIVVEGASPNAAAISTSDGHSTDGTLEAIEIFKKEEDPERKIQLITKDGFWTEKDEQSRNFFDRATGDYVWQIDIDEFYKPEDIQTILDFLARDPTISGLSFSFKNFWGGFGSTVDGWDYRDFVRSTNGIRRIFKWGKGYHFVTHRPPTVYDPQQRDLCTLKWISAKTTARMGVYCYHYAMVFPKQAEEKTKYYSTAMRWLKGLDTWHRESFQKLQHPFRVHHGTKPPSWLSRFKGSHPPEIQRLLQDSEKGHHSLAFRPTVDIEKLLNSSTYRFSAAFLGALYGPVRFVQNSLRLLKNIIFQPLRYCKMKLRGFFDPDFRKLLKHPKLKRVKNGWMYRGELCPDNLVAGNAAFSIAEAAQRYCSGEGIDFGSHHSPLYQATAVDYGTGNASKSLADFSDQSLDFIFSSHCLVYFDQWKQVLQELTKKLKLGGAIFLYLPHPSSAIWDSDSPLTDPRIQSRVLPEELKSALKELNYEFLSMDDQPDLMKSFYVCARRRKVDAEMAL